MVLTSANMGFAAHYVRQNALHFAKPKALYEIQNPAFKKGKYIML